MSRCIKKLSVFCLLLTPTVTISAPFEDCPTEAFIIQTPTNTPITYGVDLSTGSYSTLSPNMQTTKVNGAGFNYHDNYIYAWDYGSNTLSRFSNDYSPQPLTLTSGKIGQHFYVGDVSVEDNTWFGYRPNYGLYSVDLNAPDNNMSMEQVAPSSFMGNPKITDFAFHPTNNLIYAVDNNGFLRTISPSTGQTTLIGEVLNEASAGFNFVFGAQFFDVENNLYISNNSNGYIYKINVDNTEPQGVFFAYGPKSQSNDGARCALAPIVSAVGLDFGDAPDSYQTTYDASGPRHGESSLYLGALLDTESDAYVYPLSDDASDSSDDDDGISFVTGIEVGSAAIVQAEASENGGFLNAWVDWNQNGYFDNDEQIITDVALSSGNNVIPYTVPVWAKAGETWSRFRISSIAAIGPTGGVSDGEVEDYNVTITDENVTANFYPSADSYTTIAYEDLWPIEGDYDMNDLLINLNIAEYSIGDDIVRLEIDGKIAAVGAGFNNGLALQLPGISPNQIQEASIELMINGQKVTPPALEANQNYAVVVIFDNAWNLTSQAEGLCEYFRTIEGCGSAIRPNWKLTIPLTSAINKDLFPDAPYDPFIFATPNTTHSSLVDGVAGGPPGKAWEVHLKNKAPTNALNTNLLNLAQDTSSFAQDQFYQTANGMPWAIEVPEDWKHPKEKVDLREAYPHFKAFAESGGLEHTDWYITEKANMALIFQD
jgi:LruC domain-containing protein